MSFRIICAFVGVLLAVPAAAAPAADTAGSGSARASVRDACMADVKALCSDAQPGGGQIMKCLRDQKDKVSSGCKDALAAMRAARQQGN